MGRLRARTRSWRGNTSSSGAAWKASCATTRRSCARELTVGIVHEIRNGLGTILGYARLVQSAGGPGADTRGGIVEECETLETVVRRFMEFVKDDSLRPSTFDLGRMLTRVAARESKARVGPETHLPRGSVGVIEADEDLLERAFENLVRNARDAAGPSGQVWIEVERGRDAVLVTIADNGPGMPPDVRSSLRPFFTTKSGGLASAAARPTRSCASTAATCSSPRGRRAALPSGCASAGPVNFKRVGYGW